MLKAPIAVTWAPERLFSAAKRSIQAIASSPCSSTTAKMRCPSALLSSWLFIVPPESAELAPSPREFSQGLIAASRRNNPQGGNSATARLFLGEDDLRQSPFTETAWLS
ncbi:hypothetical protein CHELA1G11_13899 [Hyphomicrobiales bacterium]|nr:hypothetical protein CHELA1G2_10415 [Hyphomicrobiales bacterium]CAH1674816.1 hypothetical protein CHELA1G11_13899 [Hyphomicrobiales bacterium]